MRKAPKASVSLVCFMADSAIKPPAEKCKAQQEGSLLLECDLADNRPLRPLEGSNLSAANNILMGHAAS